MSKRARLFLKKSVSVLLAVLLMTGWLLQPAYAEGTGSAAPSTATVNGMLTKDGLGLANTIFSVHNLSTNNWFDTKSDVNGQFSFSLTDGSYELQGVWVPDENKWYPLNQTFAVANGVLVGANSLLVNISEENITPNVTGKLTNDGVPLANITFSIHSIGDAPDWYNATTDSLGQFGFSHLPNGDYQVEGIWLPTENKWYAFEQKIFTVNGTAFVNIDISRAISPDSGKFTVEGTLAKESQVLKNVVFSIHTKGTNQQWFDTKSGQDGKFTLKLPAGDYQLDGIWVESEASWYELNKSFTVNADMNWDIVVTVSEISGGITKEGKPVPNTGFSFHTKGENPKWFDAKTDENGQFILSNLPDGDYQLDGVWIAEEFKWYANPVPFTVKNGQLVGVPSLQINLTSTTGVVHGFVINGFDPVANIWFSAHTVNGETVWYDAYTNEDGEFRFDLPDGDYQIDGIWVGSENKWYPIVKKFTVRNKTLAGSSQLILDLRATSNRPNGNVQGMIQDLYGPIHQSAFVNILDSKGDFLHVLTNVNGEFGKNLADGTYRIVGIILLEDNYSKAMFDYRFDVKDGSVYVNGEKTDLLVVTIPNKITLGTITDSGNPVNDASVDIESKSLGKSTATYSFGADDHGLIKARLADGDYLITMIHDYRNGTSKPVKIDFTIQNENLFVNGVPQSSLDLSISSKAGGIHGVIQDPSGPFADASFEMIDSNYRSFTGKTNQSGAFEINLPDGQYTFTYARNSVSSTVDLQQKFSVQNGEVFVNNLKVDQLMISIPKVTTKGKVVDQRGNAISGGSLLILDNSNNLSTSIPLNENSDFNLRLADGFYFVYIINDINHSLNDNAFINQLFEVKNGTLVNKDSLTVTVPEKNFSGKLMKNGEIFENAVISIMSDKSNYGIGFRSDDNGNFSGRLADGNYTIRGVLKSGYYSMQVSFTVTNGVPSVDFSVLDISGVYGNVKGILQDGNGPIANATIWIEDSNRTTTSVRTNTKGLFGVGLADGQYTIRYIFLDDAAKAIYYPYQTLTVQNGKMYVNNVQLDNLVMQIPNEILVGKLVDKNGTPVPNASLSAYSSNLGHTLSSTRSDNEGNFKLRLMDGSYDISFIRIENDTMIQTFRFEIKGGSLFVDGKQKDSLLITVPDRNFVGKVVNGATALSMATIWLSTGSSGYGFSADNNGNFSARLPDGDYELTRITYNSQTYYVNISFNITNGISSVDFGTIDVSKFYSNGGAVSEEN